jgi:hypothetical protein
VNPIRMVAPLVCMIWSSASCLAQCADYNYTYQHTACAYFYTEWPECLKCGGDPAGKWNPYHLVTMVRRWGEVENAQPDPWAFQPVMQFTYSYPPQWHRRWPDLERDTAPMSGGVRTPVGLLHVETHGDSLYCDVEYWAMGHEFEVLDTIAAYNDRYPLAHFSIDRVGGDYPCDAIRLDWRQSVDYWKRKPIKAYLQHDSRAFIYLQWCRADANAGGYGATQQCVNDDGNPNYGLLVANPSYVETCGTAWWVYASMNCQKPDFDGYDAVLQSALDLHLFPNGLGVHMPYGGPACWRMSSYLACDDIADRDAVALGAEDAIPLDGATHVENEGVEGDSLPSEGLVAGPHATEELRDSVPMLVYTNASRPELLGPVVSYYQGKAIEGHPIALTTRLGDGSVSDMRVGLAELVGASQRPYLLIVGDVNPYIVDTVRFPGLGPWYPHDAPMASDALIADLDNDWLEDANVTRVPCNSTTDLNRLFASADRYDTAFVPQGVLLVGSTLTGVDKTSMDVILRYDELLSGLHHGVLYLHEKEYGLGYINIAAKEEAFVQRVNWGAGWIIGFGYATSWKTWPGRFVDHADFDLNQLVNPQSMVAILPGCLMGAEQLDDAVENGGIPPLGHRLLFAPTQVNGMDRATLACLIGHCNASFDAQQKLWAVELAEEIEGAPCGRPWAAIVRDAKVHFKENHLGLWDGGWKEFLAGVVVNGALVGKPAPRQVPHPPRQPKSGPDDGWEESELGDGHMLWARADREGYRLRIGTPVSCEGTLRVVDAGGRHVATLWRGEMARGMREVFWDTSSIARGVYFLTLSTSAGAKCSRKVLVLK